MTVVAIWFEPHDAVVWAVSDTRVTGQSQLAHGQPAAARFYLGINIEELGSVENHFLGMIATI
jgi:hypothetical protein